MHYSKDKLIDIGIEKLRNFGFVYADKNNVFEDDVYRYHFKQFMLVMLGRNEKLDRTIKKLFSSIDKQKK